MSKDKILRELENKISTLTRELSDEDYVEVMEELEGYCQSSADAKREEMSQ